MICFCDGSYGYSHEKVGAGIVIFDGITVIESLSLMEDCSLREFRSCNTHELFAVYEALLHASQLGDKTIFIYNDSANLNIKYYLEYRIKNGRLVFVNHAKYLTRHIQLLRSLYKKLILDGFEICIDDYHSTLLHRVFMTVCHHLSRGYQEKKDPKDLIFYNTLSFLLQFVRSSGPEDPIYVHPFMLDFVLNKANTSRRIRKRKKELEKMVAEKKIILTA